MTHLAEVSVLLALLWPRHEEHKGGTCLVREVWRARMGDQSAGATGRTRAAHQSRLWHAGSVVAFS